MSSGAAADPIASPAEAGPRSLPLEAWHVARGAKLGPFASYRMPIQYEGIVAEHRWTREHAGLFDVSHMGQVELRGPDAVKALERVVPGDVAGLRPGRVRYSLLLDDDGGILDDLLITRPSDSPDAVDLVVNGATKAADVASLHDRLPSEVTVTLRDDRALLAVQGPKAAAVVEALISGAAELVFLEAKPLRWDDVAVGVSRTGYTGEDGFELSVAAADAERLADALAAHEDVRPVGLGARDTLRLEAGLPLYGSDLDATIRPAEAGLGFAVSKRRRVTRDFVGADRVLGDLTDGTPLVRVGLAIDGRQPVRAGAEVIGDDGESIGRVTSGGFSPTLERPIAMAYLPTPMATPGTSVRLRQRKKEHSGTVAALPFVPHRYVRAAARPAKEIE